MTSASSSSLSPPGAFLVATTNDVVLTRIVGLGTMNNSVAFQQFASHLLAQGYPKFIFDLASCDGFDSTFMGIVLGIRQAGRLVVIVNTSAMHRKTLGEVGIDRVVRLVDDAIELPSVPMQSLEQKAVGSSERVRVILQAHENLVRLGESNEEKFGDFLNALRAELG